jgi:V/A-type H+-transporting ATPase subunit A
VNEQISGTIFSVDGPVVKARGMSAAGVAEQVEVGASRLIGEIIQMTDELATIQVYEDTTGMSPGDTVAALGHPLSVELGPGIVGQIYDGIQRPLEALASQSGDFIGTGVTSPALNRDKIWPWKPVVKAGDMLVRGAVIGEVQETAAVLHRVMLPPDVSGKCLSVAAEGEYKITQTAAVVETADGTRVEAPFFQVWPVRRPRLLGTRVMPGEPLVTGQRVIDFFFPIAKGGTAVIPGGFGTGKTVTQHQLAKWSDADVIVYIGCGERGNEMTQVLEEFPHLKDPRSGRPLMERTVLIANTSNMPVTAREASIYTGITIAEYFRDMGYNVALMADSTSRWAEALREIAGRLEEMPAEEGFPAYLSTRLGEFYERAGRVDLADGRSGSVSIIGAVSPQGGDFSEPVTQHTRRFTRTFWALDKALAAERHFPSINWNDSYSGYIAAVDAWRASAKGASDAWNDLRAEAMRVLQAEDRLQRVVRLVGPDALPDDQRLVLAIADIIKKGFLEQSAFDAVDSYCPMPKQIRMMECILRFYKRGAEALKSGMHVVALMDLPVVDRLRRMRIEVPNDQIARFDDIMREIDGQAGELQKEYART